MVGVIFIGTLDVCPYFEKYENALFHANKPFEAILWQRDGIQRNYPAGYNVFQKYTPPNSTTFQKVMGFLSYAGFVRKTIKKKRYSKLILLSTLSAFVCYPGLVRRYKGKYVFDFRDMSYEYWSWYRRILKKIITNSAFTSVSSKGFIEELPSFNYVISHNFRYSELEKRQLTFSHKESDSPLEITYIGGGRGDSINMQYCRAFGNDARFRLNIIGLGNDTQYLKDLVKSYNNVKLQGRYDQKEKIALLEETDLLLYYYPDSYNNNKALANKFYDGLILRKPMIVNPRSFSGKLVQSRGLGIAVDIDDKNAGNIVYNYYKSIDPEVINARIDEMLDEVLEEDQFYVQKIDSFLKTHK